ncbi:MAG TPA: hypothetical protein VH281_05505 [Gaiellaceae bacterium]|jgi:hypothetical protein
MRFALVALVVVSLVSFGCGSSAQPQAAPETLTALPASALPGLESTTGPVGVSELEADLGSSVSVEGFVRGVERVFQGESHRFDRVVSRSLEFEDADAAAAYVTLLRDHVADLYGVGTNAQPLESDGRKGILVDAASCACHRAEPTLAAAVSSGPRVAYLEVNGGGARPAAVEALLERAP